MTIDVQIKYNLRNNKKKQEIQACRRIGNNLGVMDRVKTHILCALNTNIFRSQEGTTAGDFYIIRILQLLFLFSLD